MLVPFVHLKRFLSELNFSVASVVTLATSFSHLVTALGLGLMFAKPGGSGQSCQTGWACRTQVSPGPHCAGSSQPEDLAGFLHPQTRGELLLQQYVSPLYLEVQPLNRERMSQYRLPGIAQKEPAHFCWKIWDKAEIEEAPDTYGN